jgi:hypothetical protein
VLCFLQNEKFEVMLFVILIFSAITNAALLPSTSLTLQEGHLVRCLTNISHRHFAPGRVLVISSPATSKDVQQELIGEIHRTSIWPAVVTVDANIKIPDKTDFIDRDSSYIILVPDGNVKSVKAVINGLAVVRGLYTRIWNSEARFVVAAASEFSMSQQMEIFNHFSIMRIYNCIIVSQERHVINKGYSRSMNVNDVDIGKKLGVYTWFPYQSSDRCTEVNDITLLDTWVTSAQGHFTKNTNLFPAKISNNLNGCPMKAVVRDSHWKFTTVYVSHTFSNGTVVRHIRGLEYDLLRVVLQQMNMTFVHVPTPDGFEMEDGSLISNLLTGMIGKEIYIALGDVGTNFLAVSFFDSTNTYYMLRVRWYVPCSVKYPRWSSILRILSMELWLVLIISIVIAAISTTLVGRHTCTSEWQGYKTVTSSFTNIWAVILRVSVARKPRAPSLRSLFFAWVCFSLAFSAVFQAFLTIFLIDSGYKTPIQNMDELFASGIKLAYPPEHNFIFENGDETESLNVQRYRVNCPSYEVCENWAKYHKNVSILLVDKVAEDNYASGAYVGENSEFLLCGLDDGVVFNTGLTMIMFHGDPLMRRINEIIDRVVEAGLYNFWISLSMHGLNLHSRKIAVIHPINGYCSFNLYHMQPAFYLLLIGWCLSALCFMVEVFYSRLLS